MCVCVCVCVCVCTYVPDFKFLAQFLQFFDKGGGSGAGGGGARGGHFNLNIGNETTSNIHKFMVLLTSFIF